MFEHSVGATDELISVDSDFFPWKCLFSQQNATSQASHKVHLYSIAQGACQAVQRRAQGMQSTRLHWQQDTQTSFSALGCTSGASAKQTATTALSMCVMTSPGKGFILREAF